MRQLRLICLSTLLALASLLGCANALASGGNYRFDGGTPFEQRQVVQALAVSSFDWSVVPKQITIHIGANTQSEAAPGEIWLNAGLLDAGEFSWGVVQHEYAHEVDFLLFDDAIRARLDPLLGGTVWFYTVPGLAHSAYGCERFASTLAWSYWPTPANAMQPTSSSDESAAMPPAQFRALVASVLGDASLAAAPVDPGGRVHAPARPRHR
jgi:hypothetical protein